MKDNRIVETNTDQLKTLFDKFLNDKTVRRLVYNPYGLKQSQYIKLKNPKQKSKKSLIDSLSKEFIEYVWKNI